MSLQKIVEGKQKLSEVDFWEMALIKYKHPKNSPSHFDCYTVNFTNPDELKALISTMYDNFVGLIQKKFNSDIQMYTGFSSKKCVDKILISDEVIHEPWSNLIQSLSRVDNSKKIKKPNYDAFIFSGTYKNDNQENKNIYILCKNNPVVNFKKKIFTFTNNTLEENKDTLFNFPKCFDAVIYEDTLYMINLNCETIFNLERSHKNICKKRLSEISQTNIISNMVEFERCALSNKNPQKFLTYNSDILNQFASPENLEELCQELGIAINSSTNQLEFANEKSIKNFISVICGRTKRELFEDSLCEVPTSTPLSS
ncbi:Kiwa anti-phage protein KwaB-like domain-containing protein [Turicibacter sanguinis]|uniref:Kiwa anti-phage protein KwaB-like domain-containing protein n=1 Tax=Turicibacter sanguinis TaxID=154288 RepID=UPI0029427643|nr:Kiwa anti-phage protein KwaB-like domain-containing protein [Turicibacter sanguinis]